MEKCNTSIYTIKVVSAESLSRECVLIFIRSRRVTFKFGELERDVDNFQIPCLCYLIHVFQGTFNSSV